MHPLTLLVLQLAAPLLGAQETPPQPAAPAEEVAFPARRPASRVLFFSLDGELKAEPMQKALIALSTKEVECRLVSAPQTTSARNGKNFVGVEIPVGVSEKDLLAALRKGCSAAAPLSITCFQGDMMDQGGMRGAGAGIPGLTQRDFVVGMDGDLRWYENTLGARQFFYVGRKLDAKSIAERYKKLMSGFGGNADVGKLVEEELSWSLSAPIDPAVAKRAQKALAKLPGVFAATLDAQTGRLMMRFAMDGVESSAPLKLPANLERLAKEFQVPVEQSRRAARVQFDTWPIFEVLDKEQLALAEATPKK